ncbi:MAG: Na+/H+ antiporter subunit E [Gammaproteobacteria bacterium]|jgi:multicomponent Na+:H+ antiporter subunit E
MRIAIFALLWWTLSGGDADSWLIGLPAVLLAAWSSRKLGTAASLSLSITGLLRFIPFFVWESFRGGVDVASRILVKRLRIHPGFKHYHTKLPSQAERMFFANCISLFPGTLSVRLTSDVIEIHSLDTTVPVELELEKLETAVARLFSEAINSPSQDS